MPRLTYVGSITKFGAQRYASGDKVRTITLEVHGSFEGLDALMEKPVKVTIEEET
jgi:hypothetical protein